jgi:hypothetical protein
MSAGVTARTLSTASIEGTTLYLTFGDAVTELTAGTPYIIKWDAGETDIVSPTFSGVTISSTVHPYDNGQDGNARVRFLGTYCSTTFNNEDKSILFLGGENKLYYPVSGARIGACRAYFQLCNSVAVKEFKLSFGEDVETGIVSTEEGRSKMEEVSGGWYTISGVKLNAKPTAPGIYIHNGSKVAIK